MKKKPDVWTLTQAARVLGEPQHRLIYLCEKGVIVPDFQDAEGRGSSRRFSARNLLEFAVALKLRELEIGVAFVGAVVHVLRAFERRVEKELRDFRLPDSLREPCAPDPRVVIADGGRLYFTLAAAGSSARLYGGIDLQDVSSSHGSARVLDRGLDRRTASLKRSASKGFGGPEGSRFLRLELSVTDLARALDLDGGGFLDSARSLDRPPRDRGPGDLVGALRRGPLPIWPERGSARSARPQCDRRARSLVARSTMAAPDGRFEPAPWRFQARRLPSNEPGFVRVRPAPPPGGASRAPSTVLDGVFGEDGCGKIEFHEAFELPTDHIRQLESVLQRRVLRYFRRHGLLDEIDAAGMLTWQGSGGFSVDASVRIEGEDRTGVERLVRYCARPPFALERLRALDSSPTLASPESRLLYRFPKPDVHGRTELLLSPLELLDALSKFVPPPRVHRHRYHGVLAPNARLRPHVVALGRPELVSEAPPTNVDAAASDMSFVSVPERASPARIRWAVLLARIYDVLPLLCPACGGEMRILAFLTDPPVVSAILLHLDLPHKPPPLSPARGPPQSDLLPGLLDQTSAFDPAKAEPVPDFEFDQSLPDDFEP